MSSSREVSEPQKENIAWTIVRRLGMVVVLVLVFILSATVTVYLLIRTGDTRVPADIVGRPQAEAQQSIQKAGLRAILITQNDDEHTAGTVFKTDPVPNSSVKKDSIVRVYVSTGPGQVKEAGAGDVMVPDVAGKTVAEAQAILSQAGLKAIVQKRSHPTVAANTVMETNPASKSPVKRDATIALIVSSGRPRNANGNTNTSANMNRPANTNR